MLFSSLHWSYAPAGEEVKSEYERNERYVAPTELESLELTFQENEWQSKKSSKKYAVNCFFYCTIAGLGCNSGRNAILVMQSRKN